MKGPVWDTAWPQVARVQKMLGGGSALGAQPLVIEVDGGHTPSKLARMHAVMRCWLALGTACFGWMPRSS
jgi:hypothetical protein